MAINIISNLIGALFFVLAIHAFSVQSIQNGEGPTIGLARLRNYLRALGYLNDDVSENPNRTIHDSSLEYDEHLESALKLFQKNFHLNVTGRLDSQTVDLINTPRCGVPDRINSHHLVNLNVTGSRGHFVHVGSHYAFFEGEPKWPPEKHDLTFKIESGAQSSVRPWDLELACIQAFDLWSNVSDFTFSEVKADGTPDLKISFKRGDQGNGWAFDGPGNLLAYANGPTDGTLRFDADENWSLGPPNATQVDMVWVATHEIGHLLGLNHSMIKEAIMYPFVDSGKTRRALNIDDIDGIRALYSL